MTSAAVLSSEAFVPSWSCGDISVWSLLDGTVRVPPDALDARIYDDPFYWAPFMLIGRPD